MEDTNKQHYSPEELQEFREIIERKIAEAKENISFLQEPYTPDSEGLSYKNIEEGSLIQSRLENDALAQRLQDFINKLEQALIRIENGTYGICSETGNLIPKERLRMVPHTTKSVEAKQKRPQ